MKRIILILSIIGIFYLASCNEPDEIYDSNPTTSDTTQDDLTTNDKPSNQSNTNNDTNETNKTTNEKDNQEQDNDDSSLPEYNDGTEWEGTVF